MSINFIGEKYAVTFRISWHKMKICLYFNDWAIENQFKIWDLLHVCIRTSWVDGNYTFVVYMKDSEDMSKSMLPEEKVQLVCTSFRFPESGILLECSTDAEVFCVFDVQAWINDNALLEDGAHARMLPINDQDVEVEFLLADCNKAASSLGECVNLFVKGLHPEQ